MNEISQCGRNSTTFHCEVIAVETCGNDRYSLPSLLPLIIDHIKSYKSCFPGQNMNKNKVAKIKIE